MLGFISALAGVGSALLQNYTAYKQQSANERLWQMNNEYNTPEKQVERLRKAGLNPALAMSQGAIGSGVSSSPADSFTPPNYDFSGIQNGLAEGVRLNNESNLARANVAKLGEETEAERIRNKFAIAREIMNLRIQVSQEGINSSMKHKLNREIDLLEKEYNAYDDVTYSQVRANNAKSRLDDSVAALNEIEAKYKPDEWKKVLRNLDKVASQIDSQISSNNAQAALNIALKAVEDAKKEGVEIDNQLARDTADAYVDKAYSESEEAYWKWQQTGKRYSGGTLGEKFPQKQQNGETLFYPERPDYARRRSNVPKRR